MKKFSFLFTVALLVSLLLAACGGNNAGQNLNGNGLPDTTVEPGGLEPGGIDDGTGLETLPPVDDGTGLDTTPTAEVGDVLPTEPAGDVEPTESAADLTTPTVEAADDTDTGDTAGTGESDQFVLLSDLLGLSVNGMDGQAIGQVNGVLVNRPVAAAGDMDTGMDDSAVGEATGTPEADDDAAADDDSATDDMAGTDVNASRVSYLIVSQTAAGDDAGSGDTGTDVDATPEATDDAAADDTAGDTTGQDMAGDVILVPWQAFAWDGAGDDMAAGDGSLTALTLNVDAAALSSAPAFSSDLENTVASSGWDTELSAFWSDQGIGIPITGETQSGDTIVINDLLTGFTVNDSAGTSFGTVDDFVIERATGEIVYAILSNTAGDSFYAVPLASLDWTAGADAGMSSFSFNGDATLFDTAPSFSTMDEFDFNTLGDVDMYWESNSFDQ